MILLGFKYIGNRAQELENEGFNVVFGYEEAIGFMIGSQIRDKDGISATVSSFIYNFIIIKCMFRTGYLLRAGSKTCI